MMCIALAGKYNFIEIFSASFYQALQLNTTCQRHGFHFVFMWIFAINGLLYFLYTIFSGEWNILCPISILSKKHGRYYCMICACVKQRHHKKI